MQPPNYGGIGFQVCMPSATTVATNSRDHNARVYTWSGTTWVQKGGDIVNGDEDYNGEINPIQSISMPDTNTIAYIDSMVTVYRWNGTNWQQKGQGINELNWLDTTFSYVYEGYLNEDRGFISVSMPDSNTLAIGYPDYTDSVCWRGSVRIYKWDGNAWAQKGNALNGNDCDVQAGGIITMPDSNTIAISAGERYDGEEYGGNCGYYCPTNSGLIGRGISVYRWDGITWQQKGATLYSDMATSLGEICWDGSLDMGDSNTLIISNPYHSKTGVFSWDGSSWQLKGDSISDVQEYQENRRSISSYDSNHFVIGYHMANSGHGLVRAYEWNGSTWQQYGNNVVGDKNWDSFGYSVSMFDTNTFAVSVPHWDDDTTNCYARVYSMCATEYLDTLAGCDSLAWIDGNTYTASTDTPTVYLTNAAGCDSVIMLRLTLNSTVFETHEHTACDTFTWVDSLTYTSSNNTAIDTSVSSAGCPLIASLDLTMNYSSYYTDTVSGCDSITWLDGNTYTATNDSATWHTTNAIGCDSVITLHLTIDSTSFQTFTHTACDSFMWIDSVTYTASNNTALDTLTNQAGCQLIASLDLTINNSSTFTDQLTACNNYTWIDSIVYTASNNTATYLLTNAIGCDSLVKLDLTIDTVSNLSISQNWDTLVAGNASGTYQWLDCDANYDPILGETAQQYVPDSTGYFAVEITEAGCVDTTACIEVTTLGIPAENTGSGVIIFPNPADDVLTISFNLRQSTVQVMMYSMNGSLLLDETINEAATHELDLSKIPAGTYLLELESSGSGKSVHRIVKR